MSGVLPEVVDEIVSNQPDRRARFFHQYKQAGINGNLKHQLNVKLHKVTPFKLEAIPKLGYSDACKQ